MFWNKYLFPSVIVLIAVAFLNWLGGSMGYYWTTNWYDWVVHFLGGVWTALFILWAAELRFFASLKPFLSARIVVVMVFCVGVLWEIYELAFALTDYHDRGYAWDTTHDILMDVFGAIVVCIVLKILTKKMAHKNI